MTTAGRISLSKVKAGAKMKVKNFADGGKVPIRES
jgi:hypothetical protein